MAEVLRSKNLATKFQILLEVAANQPNIQQKDIASRLNITSQAVSEYAIVDKIYVLIRREDITLTLSKGVGSARNTFRGKIVRMALVGPLIRIEVDCGFPLLALVTKKSAEELNLAIDKLVHTSFKASAIRTLKRWD